MKNRWYLLLLPVLIFFNSCSVVEGIFKAGVWVGIMAVAVILGLIIYFVGKAKK